MGLSASAKQRLRNRYGTWAVITGASSGIGRELANLLATAEFNLVLVARSQDALEALAKSLSSAHGIDVVVIQADLSREESWQKVTTETDRLDVGLFIASAGFGTSGTFGATDLDTELNMLAVNCQALFAHTHHFVRKFKERGRGGIILLSSMVGFQGVPYAAHYAATKAYVQSLGEALAVELKQHGIDVLAAAPGPVNTGFEGRAGMNLGNAMSPVQVALPILKALGRRGTVLPGFLTKFLVTALRTVPRWGKVRVMKIVMGGMTKAQRA
ncbi:MAG: SDR family oxidoreductase [Bacteroidota bacterium]